MKRCEFCLEELSLCVCPLPEWDGVPIDDVGDEDIGEEHWDELDEGW